MGGAGLALPAAICSFTIAFSFFATVFSPWWFWRVGQRSSGRDRLRRTHPPTISFLVHYTRNFLYKRPVGLSVRFRTQYPMLFRPVKSPARPVSRGRRN